jgi:hypothetical protein
MTVKELIEILKRFDGDMFVSVEKDGIDYAIGSVRKDVIGDVSVKI